MNKKIKCISPAKKQAFLPRLLKAKASFAIALSFVLFATVAGSSIFKAKALTMDELQAASSPQVLGATNSGTNYVTVPNGQTACPNISFTPAQATAGGVVGTLGPGHVTSDGAPNIVLYAQPLSTTYTGPAAYNPYFNTGPVKGFSNWFTPWATSTFEGTVPFLNPEPPNATAEGAAEALRLVDLYAPGSKIATEPTGITGVEPPISLVEIILPAGTNANGTIYLDASGILQYYYNGGEVQSYYDYNNSTGVDSISDRILEQTVLGCTYLSTTDQIPLASSTKLPDAVWKGGYGSTIVLANGDSAQIQGIDPVSAQCEGKLANENSADPYRYVAWIATWEYVPEGEDPSLGKNWVPITDSSLITPSMKAVLPLAQELLNEEAASSNVIGGGSWYKGALTAFVPGTTKLDWFTWTQLGVQGGGAGPVLWPASVQGMTFDKWDGTVMSQADLEARAFAAAGTVPNGSNAAADLAAGKYSLPTNTSKTPQQFELPLPPASCYAGSGQPAQSLTCATPAISANIGNPVTFSALGGIAPYSWSGGENPATSTGSSFTTSYSTAGNKTATVSSQDGQNASCSVTITSTGTPGTYPTVTITSATNLSLKVTATPLSYDSTAGAWTYQIYWKRTRNAQGSLYVTLKSDKTQVLLTVDPASQTGTQIVTLAPPPPTAWNFTPSLPKAVTYY